MAWPIPMDLDSTVDTHRVGNRLIQAYAGTLHSVRLKRPSSMLMNNNIDHLPESLLVEILCRLPCFKSVSQCKLVSKRWCTLLSDSRFIRHFLCVQRNRNQKPMGTTISMNGEEFLNRVSPSSRPLAQLFKRLVSIHGLKQEPIVVGTYNDLVLCCASMHFQRDYYICNPHTVQWVPLPPPPHVYKYVTVGFTCDLPYYNYREDDQQGAIVQLNVEYKYRVVRLIDPTGGYDDDDDDDDTISCEIKAQIFFSETGEWRQFVLSSPSAIAVGDLCMESSGVASNRMLYWLHGKGEFLIGLDPFMIEKSDNTSSAATAGRTDYKCFFSECGEWDSVPMNCLVTLDGCPRMCEYYSPTRTLSIWEVNEAKEEDQMAMIRGGAGNVCVKPYKSIYLGDEEMVVISRGIDHIRSVVFDPDNEGLLYLLINNTRELIKIDVIRCNIRTGEMSKVATSQTINCLHLYPFVLPWWPTPLRQLPQRGQPSPNLPT
ncbi:hypothetical protein DVH24_017616 [Malus domestica]|uniref:F-box domain-containing protein n=1 Tax=Malus domestica TaxID=3750 RepID=A0A498KGP2_MALDO|nr:hypothetical protein DVH24_017616 [Malus domestica]